MNVHLMEFESSVKCVAYVGQVILLFCDKAWREDKSHA